MVQEIFQTALKIGMFYVTVTWNFERFQYFNFKTNFPENFFQKTRVQFFS